MVPAPLDPLQPAVGRRERAKADRRARILAAARRLLAGRGYDRMTMSEVAREADVAAGTVFQYAATKPELLMMATAERWAGVIPDLVERSRDLPPREAIRTLLTPFAVASLGDTATAVAVAREVLFGAEGEHRNAVLAMVQQVEDAIAVAIAAESPERGAASARLILSGAIVELNRSRTGQEVGDATARIDELVDIVLAGTR